MQPRICSCVVIIVLLCYFIDPIFKLQEGQNLGWERNYNKDQKIVQGDE